MKDKKLYRKITVRLFPTPEQETHMKRHAGARRFMWNYMISFQEENYKNGGRYLNKYNMCRHITQMKKAKEFLWLNEISNATLQNTCRDLDRAYVSYFNKIANYPKYKSKKKSAMAFPISSDKKATYFKSKSILRVPKIGDMKYKSSKQINSGVKIYSPIIMMKNKKWLLVFSVECETQTRSRTENPMGIDLGVKDLAVVAVKDKKLVFYNINKSKRMRALKKKEKHIQRAISRKYRVFNGFGTPKKGQARKKSRSIEKYEQILREIRAKMANIRHDYIHQTTRQLVSLLPACVVMEDLNVASMLKNKHLARSILEQNFNLFIRTMKYKCEEYGIDFVQADKYFPSSKLCSCCGYKNKSLKLKDREWTCPNCGTHHDRDYNAAINLMNYTENKNTTSVLVSTQKSGSTLVA